MSEGKELTAERLRELLHLGGGCEQRKNGVPPHVWGQH